MVAGMVAGRAAMADYTAAIHTVTTTIPLGTGAERSRGKRTDHDPQPTDLISPVMFAMTMVRVGRFLLFLLFLNVTFAITRVKILPTPSVSRESLIRLMRTRSTLEVAVTAWVDAVWKTPPHLAAEARRKSETSAATFAPVVISSISCLGDVTIFFS